MAPRLGYLEPEDFTDPRRRWDHGAKCRLLGSAGQVIVHGSGRSPSLSAMALGGHPVQVTCAYPGVVRTPIMRSGTFADGEDAAAVADGFDRLARTNPDQAAEVILRRARQGRARAVVGADAHAAALAVFVIYQLIGRGQLVPGAYCHGG